MSEPAGGLERNTIDMDFTKILPKIELHAHLTGSVSPQTLHEVWIQRRDEDPTTSLEDPLKVMLADKSHLDVFTFFPLFDTYIYSLVDTIDAIRFSTTAVLNAFASDGVRYLELRTTPRAVITAGISKHDYISTVLDCISDFTQKNQNKMPTYLILSVDRKNSASVAMQTIDLAIEFRSKGVVGVDLCGNPAKGDVSIFKDAFLKARQAGLRLTLHFAEVPASSTEKELKTLLSYEPDRLGHVIHVPSEIAGEIASRKLGLELCLSCNVLAKLTEGGFGDHHFGYWRQQHCPIILCTDDVGVFGSPLSHEYWLAAKHFSLTRKDLIELSIVSVDAIFAGNEEKERLRQILKEFESSI